MDAAAFCATGVALWNIYLRFTWQAWYFETLTFVSRGRRGTYGTGLALVARLVSYGAVTPRPFAWQAWHFVTFAFTLRGRYDTMWDPPSLCVVDMALDNMDYYFAWQVWYVWHWVGSGGALGQPWRRDAAAFCVAGIALRDISLRPTFTLHTTCTHTTCTYIHNLHIYNLLTHNLLTQLAHTQLTHTQLTHTQLAHTQLAHIQLATCTYITYLVWSLDHFSSYYLSSDHLFLHNLSTPNLSPHNCKRRGFLRDRCGTLKHLSSFYVAGVVLWNTHLRFTWQAWYVWYWVGSGGALGQLWRRDTAAFCVAGMALRDICLHFAWQAWYLWHWVGSGGALGHPWRRHGAAFCVADVALRIICLHFAWQTWHYMRSTFALCGRRGAWWHGLLLCVAGVALMALRWLWRRAWSAHGAVMPRPFAWQTCHFETSALTLRRRRGAMWDPTSLCVVDMALDNMDYYFAWQVWYVWHWVGSGGALGQPWRRDAAAFCVAGIALRDISLRPTFTLHTTCTHTTCTYITCTYTTYSHTTYSHNLHTHNLLTHNLHTHTTYSHTTCNLHIYNILSVVIRPLLIILFVIRPLVFTQFVHTQLVTTQL